MTKKPLDLSGTPNREKLIREAKRLNAVITYPNRTGEVKIITPFGNALINNRRKDGTRILLVLLRKMQAQEQDQP